MKMLSEEDIKILRELRNDSRLTVREVAKITKVSPATVHRRLNTLIKNGYIKRFTIEPDWIKVNKSTAAYVLINMDYRGSKNSRKSPEQTSIILKHHPFVLECATITGSKDMLLKIRCKDTNELRHFVDYIRTFKEVVQTETLVVLYEAEDYGNVFDKGSFENRES